MTREALESKFGGGGDAILNDLSAETLSSPDLFAMEMYDLFGKGAVQFYVTIVKYGESGSYVPKRSSEIENYLKGIVEGIVDERPVEVELPVRPRAFVD